MKINIASSHRFHLLDLARELERLGHDVRFYSYVPTKRAIKFGLQQKCSYSLFYLMLPLLVLNRISKNSTWSLKIINCSLDLYMSLFMRSCDIYIAIGYVYKRSFVAARKRFGAITINDWGSKHNEEQWDILSTIPKIKQQSVYFKKRVIDAYNFADFIAIPSDHVKQSFIDRGISSEKLIQNPYGVDLLMFRPTKLNENKAFDAIMVGSWSYVKGCDLISTYFNNSDLTFLHVGSITDFPFPSNRNMCHIESVDQRLLIHYYSQARIFILPSRAEGLAMVQSQALACGLPIVCSKHTGGRDLRNFLEDKKWIIEMNDFTCDELSRCINEALALAKTQIGFRSYAQNIENSLSWKMYGIRYDTYLNDMKRNFSNKNIYNQVL
jgi:glycosyltransferase involved in cell wall biosynthesis